VETDSPQTLLIIAFLLSQTLDCTASIIAFSLEERLILGKNHALVAFPTQLKKESTMKSAAKKKPTATVRPVRERLTKSALIGHIAEKTELSRAQVAEVLSTLEHVMYGSVHPNGSGEFILPGVLKITLRKVPARKAGTLIRNPATGEMMKAAAKPATVRVKVRALSKLKSAAV
jgi:nucleoid DNA-binding protein